MRACERPVIVCGGREPIERIRIAEEGVIESWPVRHTTNPADIQNVELAIDAVEARQTNAIANWLRPLARPDTTVLVAQNRLAARPLEYEALTGAVVRAAEPHGVTFSANRFVHAPVLAIRPEEAA